MERHAVAHQFQTMHPIAGQAADALLSKRCLHKSTLSAHNAFLPTEAVLEVGSQEEECGESSASSLSGAHLEFFSCILQDSPYPADCQAAEAPCSSCWPPAAQADFHIMKTHGLQCSSQQSLTCRLWKQQMTLWQ